MPAPPLRRWFRGVLAVLLMAGVVLGLLPPVFGGGVPPTVVRTVAIDASRFLPSGITAVRTPDGSLRLGKRTWTDPSTTCAPIRFTMVGFVWRQGGDAVVPARVRWGERGDFGKPVRLLADPDEGPDQGSPDDSGWAGTHPLWTGEARCARFRLRLPAAPVDDLHAVFINTSGTATEPSPLDAAGDLLARIWGVASAEPALAAPAQPGIITREGWGANEGLRRCGPDYAEDGVKMAYVHHTVNSNGYGMAQADDLIRGIYAYHVQGRHFCDIAYNFLIDRFGRIYEGRYGGMEQPVIGGHAMGFNTGSVGVAALGDFTTTRPPRVMIRAYKRLLAWRLDVAHVQPTGKALMESGGGPNQKFDQGEEVRLPVVAGHRDTGFTTCPGARLYTKLRAIRRGAEGRGLPKMWDPRETPTEITYGLGTPVRYRATLSEAMSWTIDVQDQYGVLVKQMSGQGALIDVTWDGRDQTTAQFVLAGPYTAYVRAQSVAGVTAREAVLTLTVS